MALNCCGDAYRGAALKRLNLLLLLTSCSLSLPYAGSATRIDCSRVEEEACPSRLDAEMALALFAAEYPAFNVHAPLTLEWFPYGLPIYNRSWAEAPNSRRVRASRLRDLPHELVHVMHWRAGSRDDNHELPPGPWTDDDNVRVNRIKAAYAVAFGVDR